MCDCCVWLDNEKRVRRVPQDLKRISNQPLKMLGWMVGTLVVVRRGNWARKGRKAKPNFDISKRISCQKFTTLSFWGTCKHTRTTPLPCYSQFEISRSEIVSSFDMRLNVSFLAQTWLWAMIRFLGWVKIRQWFVLQPMFTHDHSVDGLPKTSSFLNNADFVWVSYPRLGEKWLTV